MKVFYDSNYRATNFGFIEAKDCEDHVRIDDDDEIDVSLITTEAETADELNQQRNKELNDLVVDSIHLTESLLKTFESTIGKSTRRKKKVTWINVNNDLVQFTPLQAQRLADKTSDIIEGIYFKYRNLKNELGAN